jgi:hypothetical protein
MAVLASDPLRSDSVRVTRNVTASSCTTGGTVLLPTIVATISLLTGIVFYIFTTGSGKPHQYSSLIIAWLLIALTPVFLVFTFFPTSEVSGALQGFTFGGAIAAFVFIWVYGSRTSAKLVDQDSLQARLEAEHERADAANLEMARASAQHQPAVLAEQRIVVYRLAKRRSRRIGLITGDLLNVRSVDLWVNSENTNMQMSRFYESTISATIRYNGARRDANGVVVEDLIADELNQKLGGALSVAPATVLLTSAGELARSHNVRAVLHVAAVFGEPAAGYRRVSDIARCVINTLDAAERIGGDPPPGSIVFPLLGVGSAKAGLEPTVKLLIAAALSWLETERSVNLSAVYFLAYRDSELLTCEKVLADSGAVRR